MAATTDIAPLPAVRDFIAMLQGARAEADDTTKPLADRKHRILQLADLRYLLREPGTPPAPPTATEIAVGWRLPAVATGEPKRRPVAGLGARTPDEGYTEEDFARAYLDGTLAGTSGILGAEPYCLSTPTLQRLWRWLKGLPAGPKSTPGANSREAIISQVYTFYTALKGSGKRGFGRYEVDVE